MLPTPTKNCVYVERLPAPEITRGGLIVPHRAREQPLGGVVLAVGPGWVSDANVRMVPEVRPGDRVLFTPYAGNELRLDGRDLVIVRAEDILAVLEEGEQQPMYTPRAEL